MNLPPDVHHRVEQWLSPPYDAETRKAVKSLLKTDPSSVLDAFGSTITFGTGGMRGIMGVGTNRLNRYTIGSATQGLANYMLNHVRDASIFISYDSRKNSFSFAQESACVLAGNGIKVFLTPELRPTPFVSFGCRFYQCSGAIMITASHNPPKYNGYKVYWSDGAQVVPPHDLGIMDEVARINHPDQIKRASLDSPLITHVGSEVDEAYFNAMTALQNFPSDNAKAGSSVHLIYSPLHGAGITTLPEGLKRWGFSSLSLVKAQASPDPSFPTVSLPNPEEKEALSLGIEQLMHEQGDLFLASDPDADRLAVVVRHDNRPIILNGNQVAALCLYYLCLTLTQAKKMPKKGAFVTTIVTTELLQAIATSFGKPCFAVLTGFKYIGEKIHHWKNDPNGYQFIFGAEESLGYLYGTQVRDKDATISACLIAEMALKQKKQKKTLIDLLYDIYRQFGLFKEKQLSIPLKGAAKGTHHYMSYLRTHMPREITGEPVVSVQDYLAGKEVDLLTGKETPLTLPSSDVIALRLKSGSKYVIRPSGTEPKIKLYGMVQRKAISSIEMGLQECDKALDSQLESLRACYFS